MKQYIFSTFYIILSLSATAQQSKSSNISKVWVADLGNGKFKNPILNADYSDPDAIRVGEDYYLTASSFNHAPGLPILHSKDMVNWTIIGHALQKQIPLEIFNKVQHGNGVWAPAIRFHNGEFYIYYPDPDYGIYLVKTKNPAGPWSEPVLVYEGKGLIDPCPLWDEDGKVYLVHAYAGSRAGIKSIISLAEMNKAGDKVIGNSEIVYDGHETDPTIEGPKIYKRNGFYYIFAPAGGVPTGWQLVMRSKNIYGPYERKVVMDQGKSPVNGPHQGAWVNTPTGEDWFFHFQDKGAYGRVVHLQPMKWINNWPVIGLDKDGDGVGEPVLEYKKPNVGKTYSIQTPLESDEFDHHFMSKQWQWQANNDGNWAYLGNTGFLRLYAKQILAGVKNLFDVPNIIAQKFPSDEFTATAKMKITPNERIENERFGFTVLGQDYSALSVKTKKDGLYLQYGVCKGAMKGSEEKVEDIVKLDGNTIYLRVKVTKEAKCNWFYSVDGQNFIAVGETFIAQPGRWVGAKLGLFAVRDVVNNDGGYADIDWFRIEPNQ